MEKKMFSLRRGLGLLLTVVMLVLSLGTNAFAVTGSTVAADGTYTGSSTTGKSMSATVTVSNGVITSVTSTDADKSEYRALVTKWSNSLSGKEASYSAVDAVTAASTKKKYGPALKSATLNALSNAPARDTGSGSGGSEEESEIGKGVGAKTGSKYTGTASIDDEYVTLDVYVENGVITGIFIAAEKGDWLELLTSKWDTYNGMNADSGTVDAVTSSTTKGFEATLRNAISAALANSGSGTGGGTGSGGGNEGGEEEEPGEPTHTKAIDPENTVSDEYNITLNVTGQNKNSTTPGTTTTTNKVDVLFIADMSYSMYSTKSNMDDGYGNMRTLDEALRYILSYNSGNSGLIPDILNSSEIDAQVAVVSFSDTATTQTGWTNSKSSAYRAVWNMNAMYGNETNVAAGLTEGQTLLNSGREDAAKVVILLSDGDANRPVDEATGKAQAISAARNMSGSVTKFYAIGFNNASSGFMQDIASQFVNYSWKDAGNMSSVASELNTMKGELSSLPVETSVPMSGVVISDTLSDYVELSHADSSDKYGITVKADNADFTDFSVAVSGKKVDVALNGELTDGTVYTAFIPVKPSETAQNEANAKDEAVSEFVSNSGATLTYGYGSDAAKTVYYTETPKILVAKQVTLTYDANGGTSAPEAEKQKVDADTKKASFMISSAEPTRDNYTFLGWAESADADTATYSATAEGMEKSISIDQDTTLYAVWSQQFKVKYEVTGDAPATSSPLPEEATYAVGADVAIADVLTTEETKKEEVPGTWTFNGWKNGEEEAKAFKMPDEDVTLTGTWTFTPNSHKVTYTVTGDAPATSSPLPEEATYAVGADVAIADVLTTEETKKEEVPGTWTFNGWKNGEEEAKAFQMPAADVTLTGTWKFEAAKYKVNFVNYDNAILQSDIEVEYGATPEYKGKMPEKPADEQYTYEFSGWQKVTRVEESNLSGLLDIFFMKAIAAEAPLTTGIVPVTEDTTYQAQFTAIPKGYTVTFDTDGGSEAPESQNVASNGTAKKPEKDPTKEGKIFDGWTLNGQPYDFATPVTGDITLTAKWREAYKVTTKEEGHTYEIYQIFTGDLSSTTVGEGDDATTKDILVNLVWGEDGTGTTGTAVDEDTIKALKEKANEELDKTKLAEIEKYVTLDGNPYKTITSKDGKPVSTEGIPAGYYLIRDKADSQTGKDDAYTTYITVIVNNYTVAPKSVKPSVDKQVSDDKDADGDTSDNTSTDDNNTSNKNVGVGGFYESADHAINEKFQFKLTATLPASDKYVDYDEYKLVFHDTMSAGVTFDGIESVKLGDTVLEAGEGVGKYQISGVSQGDAGKAWTLTAILPKAGSDENAIYSNLKNGATVEVIYNAYLNDNATVHSATAEDTETNMNAVYLEYSNNPNVDVDPRGDHKTDMGKTTEDYVWVFTYQINNTKYKDEAKAGNELAGAGFRLYAQDGTEIALKKSDAVYVPTTETGEEMKSADDGTFNIKGLDAGTYVIKETSVPSGYNDIEDKTITISAAHGETDRQSSAKLNLGESAMAHAFINKSGSELPTTGGIGTTIFYIVGGILVIGAGIVLITRRRMAD